MSPFDRAVASVLPLDQAAMAAAARHHLRLTKPAGSLGRLEAIGVQLAAIAGSCPPPMPAPAAVAVFAADHGVVAEGVTPWPREVTAQMVANFLAGGAAINVLARAAGATVTVVDVGVATPLAATATGPPGRPGPALISRPVRAGTANLAVEAAMTIGECRQALDIGAEVAAQLAAAGARLLVAGDMGIGSTTAAAAVIAALGPFVPAAVTGRGTGIDDAALARKVEVVERALALHAAAIAASPLAALAAVGGLEIAALAGFVVGGAAAGLPVVVDGVVTGAALLAAERLAPGTPARCIAGHRSTEPGAPAVLDLLGLHPVLDLGMRLGEGSGACLAVPVVQAAARVLAEMATFDGAGVSERG